jgi:hypothetical protein
MQPSSVTFLELTRALQVYPACLLVGVAFLEPLVVVAITGI